MSNQQTYRYLFVRIQLCYNGAEIQVERCLYE